MAVKNKAYSLLVMLFSLPEQYPEDGRRRALKIIDVYLPGYIDFFSVLFYRSPDFPITVML
jgi:hypothetical protein